MTRNRWIDLQRKRGRMDVRDPEIMKIIADDEVPSAEDNFMMQQSSDILREEIKRLKPIQQQAIRKSYMEFKTHKEISAEMGIPLGTVKTRIRTGMETLRSNMARNLRKL